MPLWNPWKHRFLRHEGGALRTGHTYVDGGQFTQSDGSHETYSAVLGYAVGSTGTYLLSGGLFEVVPTVVEG
jgi:hypothetical protein